MAESDTQAPPPAGASPRRRAPILIAAVVLLAAAVLALVAVLADDDGPSASSTPQTSGTADDTRPNIVLVLTDDQDMRMMRALPKTQRLLGGRGTTFANFFTSFPLCCPSRATILTGQYAHNTGVKTDRGYPDFKDRTATPVALKRSGYRTAYIGKYINGYAGVARFHPDVIPAGWSRWFAMLSSRMYNWKADDQGNLLEYGHDPGDYQTDVFANRAQRFVRHSEKVGKPFYLQVATLAPHGEPKRTNKHKWPSPQPARRDKGQFAHAGLPKVPSFNERRIGDKPPFLRHKLLGPGHRRGLKLRIRSRLGSMGAVDDMVAKLVREVRDAGELDNTYFVFTSDNGYLLGEHRQQGKALLYEESIRVPMIIRGPGIPAGVTREQITSNIDLSPTFLDIAGANPLVQTDGISLLPLARDPQVDADRDLLLESWKHDFVSKGVRAPRYVYMEHNVSPQPGPDQFELYDLRRDPYELRNRYRASLDSAANPRLAAAREHLQARLRELRDCAGGSGPDPCR